MYHLGRNLSLNITDGTMDHSGGYGRHLLGNRLRPCSKVCSVCCYVVLGFVSCVLSVWNSYVFLTALTETDIIRGSPMTPKVF